MQASVFDSIKNSISNLRANNRNIDELRTLKITPYYYPHTAGSCLIELGNTKLICVASIDEKTPRFLKNTNKGWLTAEYSMLPNSCATRVPREVSKGKLSPRTSEIQRLIGRSLRAALDLTKIKEKQITIDCDVILADGGTRTASITGGYVALALAVKQWLASGVLKRNPLIAQVAAVSCGVVSNAVMLDLDYSEDSCAEVDANFVMTDQGSLIEVQASAEGKLLPEDKFLSLMQVAKNGIKDILAYQQQILNCQPEIDGQKCNPSVINTRLTTDN